MSEQTLTAEPVRVDEPSVANGYADVFSRVAAERQTVIMRRNGEDLAAIVPLEQLTMMRELFAQQEVERKAAQIDWAQARKTLRPPQAWFDGDEPKPFASQGASE